MLERIKGGITLLPLILVPFIGGKLLVLTAFILSLVCIKELYGAFKMKGIKHIPFVALGHCLIVLLTKFFSIPMQLITASYFILFVFSVLFIIRSTHNIIDFCVTIFSTLYISIPFNCIVNVYELSNQSFNLIWLIFIIAFSNDSFAYLVGKKIGKRKLIPHISPNKTVEGSLGGIIGTVIVLTIVSICTGLNLTVMIITAVLGSILAQIGDLFASAIKRYSGVKDFSNTIPGHGGFIDRFDSILFVAPLILLVAQLISV